MLGKADSGMDSTGATAGADASGVCGCPGTPVDAKAGAVAGLAPASAGCAAPVLLSAWPVTPGTPAGACKGVCAGTILGGGS